MAYLNVRERRIEATIAYVGPELAGKATNFKHLELASPRSRVEKSVDGTPEARERLSLSWHPSNGSARFRDCDVVVTVVAQRGGLDKGHPADVLREADGVVLVVDAHPSAQARNRESLSVVRHLLKGREGRDVPVVLQVNKSDLPDALPAGDVVGALDAQTLKHISASAARGDGVVETLEAALAEVLASLHDEGKVMATPEPAPDAAASAAARDAGHPLLAALRQVLRETVREHVDELESRLTSRLDAAFARLEDSLVKKRGADEAAALARVEDHLVRRMREAEARMQVIGTAFDTRLDAIEGVMDTRVQSLGAAVAGAAQKNDIAAVASRLDKLRDDIRTEVIRASETRGRADREHLATATSSIKRSIDTLTTDVRTLDVRPQLGELSALVAENGERTESVVDGIKALGPRVVRLDDTVRSLRSETAEGLHACVEHGANVRAQVTELVEELKKPKKGWFA